MIDREIPGVDLVRVVAELRKARAERPVLVDVGRDECAGRFPITPPGAKTAKRAPGRVASFTVVAAAAGEPAATDTGPPRARRHNRGRLEGGGVNRGGRDPPE